MGEVVFTSNDSEYSRLEGLYVKEVNPPASVTGVSMNVTAMAAETLRGPVGKTVTVGNEQRFLDVFGGRSRTSGGTLANYGWKALLNKRFGSLVVARAAAAGAVAASFTMEDSPGGSTGSSIVRIDATSVGTWGNDVYFKITDASDAVGQHWNLTVKYLGNTYEYKNLNTLASNNNLVATIGDDDANWVVVTKLADGRPCNTAGISGADADGYLYLGQTVSGFTAVVGTDGTIADSDFTGTGKAMELIAADKTASIFFVAERSSATIKAKVATLAAASNKGVWLITADNGAVSAATQQTEAASYRSDRIVYCANYPYTLDPDISTAIQVDPCAWMAGILSQTDVDIHPGEEDCKEFTAGITKLTTESYTRSDYINFKNAGISALEKDNGYAFVSGVTTSLTPGLEQITRRRSADYIIHSLAGSLKYMVKKKNTLSRRQSINAVTTAFLNDLKKAERIVEDFEVDSDKLNTVAQRALGIEKLLVRVKLLGHILALVLQVEVGTDVTISQAAA